MLGRSVNLTTLYSVCPIFRTYTNSADPVYMLQDEASDQGLFYLHKNVLFPYLKIKKIENRQKHIPIVDK